ncbi:hypothetical protein DICPUDRAFT_157534 [Dictyostelium purpureum]|uniref:Uncharacterized protein n=1 Tax=Dictyostelium purpureum TaxID=5786 RepID=F0ZZD0_DICPU|nr:uncharacterized protein DICPUDRAFT_157534 [Dictyostelium purpureum]EGC30703.1 hypothetical protein DICPUDRAFT_157534 [Dictyostelium purpureum]|eukprot:XP_003292766.1 hypothetical protein DICPUDRAFT_157534 [Dictyostelium purpureum]
MNKNKKNNEDDDLNVSSFRITINSLKQDLYLLEKFEENKYYQDFIIEQIKQYKQEKNDLSSSDSAPSSSTSTSATKSIDNTTIPNENESDNINNKNTIDIFDLILKNVNIDEIDDDYVYVREIDNELCLKDINSTTPTYTPNTSEYDDNNSDSLNKDHNDMNKLKLRGSKDEDNDDDDEDEDDYSNGSIDDIKNDDNQENEENKIRKELKSHDNTFNEAFKFIDINKWLKTKGLDIISDEGSIETDLKECMDQLQSKINELNSLININNNTDNNTAKGFNKTLSSNVIINNNNNNNNDDDDEDIK